MASSKEHRIRSLFACDICKRIKMKCVPLNGNASDPKPPCQRCARIGHRCTFQGLDQAPPKGKKRRRVRSNKRKNSDNERSEVEVAEINMPILPSSSRDMRSSTTDGDDYVSLLESPLIFNQLQSINHQPTLSVNHSSFSFSPSSGEIGERASTINTDTSNMFDLNSEELNSPVSIDSTTRSGDTISVREKMHPLALLAEASLGINPNFSSIKETNNLTRSSESNINLQSQNPSSSSSTKKTTTIKYWPGNEIPPTEHKVISNNLLNWTEVENLFEIYFKGFAQHFLVLDPSFHTVDLVAQRSNVLLTTICALASRSFPARPTLHKELFELANSLISTSIADGRQSVELIQSLLLLSMWPLPMSRWEDGKSWIFSGIAFRMATELNLHELGSEKNELKFHQSTKNHFIQPETIAKEIRNQERCYLTCFSVDQSFSTMRGRPTVLSSTALIREWNIWIKSPICKRWEVGICAFVDLMGMLTEQCKSMQQMQKVGSDKNSSLDFSDQQFHNIDHSNDDGSFLSQIHMFDDKIEEWRERWIKRGLFHHHSSPLKDDLENHLFSSIVEQMPLRYNYAKLVINSMGLQHCLLIHARSTEIDVLFSRCWRASSNLLNSALEGMRPLIKYLPDTQFLVLCYASVSLLKLRCHPMASLSEKKNVNAILLVTKVAKLLDSVSVTPNHHPAIYSSFLWSILRRIGGGNQGSYQEERNDSTRESSLSACLNTLNPRDKRKQTSEEESSNSDNFNMEYNDNSLNSEDKEIVDAYYSSIHPSFKNPQPLFVQWPEALSGSDFDFGCGNLMEFKENILNSQQESDVFYQDFWDKVVPSTS
ncbi:hypothetical protein L7F22_067883 [Adiantum nelumboides]|nr:hypothetical protein [Adiantum nelumboides]